MRVAKHAYELGVVGFFTKPFDPAAMAEFVRDVIADVRGKARHALAGGRAGEHAFERRRLPTKGSRNRHFRATML